MLNFLRCCVMFLMHRIPYGRTNASAEPHREGLDCAVERTDSGKTKVTAFMLNPSTTRLKCDERENRCVYIIRRKPRSHSKVKCEFKKSEINVNIVGFKASLLHEGGAHLSEIRRHFFLLLGKLHYRPIIIMRKRT